MKQQSDKTKDAKKAVHLFVFPGFADWEAAHAVAELRRHGGYTVETVGRTMSAVESMGGIVVQPSRILTDIDPGNAAVFILPGGELWEEHLPDPELVDLLTHLDGNQTPIAAICAATIFVVANGLLRGRRHTSNGLAYLCKHAPGYREGSTYVDEPAVRDDRLITANGLADVEFAREIMAELEVLNEEERNRWARLFRSGRIPTERNPA